MLLSLLVSERFAMLEARSFRMDPRDHPATTACFSERFICSAHLVGDTALNEGAPLGFSPGRVARSCCCSSPFLLSILDLILASCSLFFRW